MTEPRVNALRKPEADSRCCPECRGLGSYLESFASNFARRCGRCNGVGWLRPASPAESEDEGGDA